MKTKKLILLLTTALFTISTVLVTYLFTFKSSKESTATEPVYDLNVSELSTSNKNLTTSSGNQITFTVSRYSSKTFQNNAYIRNSKALSGLKSISISFVTENADLQISYGWTASDYCVTEVAMNSSNTTYNFGNESPSFFSIDNKSGGNVVIQDIELTYSCVATSMPDKYFIKYDLNSGSSSYYVSGYRAGLVHAVISDTYNGYPVTKIGGIDSGKHGFEGCTTLESVSIPTSVKTISSSAFSDCTSLSSITLPSSITSVSASSFSNASSLEEILVDSGNTSYCDIDGVLFNKNCTNLICMPCGTTRTSYTIPNSVTKIHPNAFDNCSSLESITLSTNIDTLSNNSFANCSNLESISSIPEGVTSIPNFCFYNCSKLASISLPTSLASIENSAFNGCSSLDEVDLPTNLETLGSKTFFNCTSLETISIPASLSKIPTSCFEGCTSLETINIPSTTKIDTFAFKGCTSLLSITVPSSITELSNSCFSGCTSLATVSFPQNLISIGSQTFYNCTSLSSIVLPDTVETIASSAFYSCPLASLTIPSSVTSIGSFAFDHGSFSNVIYNGTVDEWNSIEIGKNAFRGASTITCTDGVINL